MVLGTAWLLQWTPGPMGLCLFLPGLGARWEAQVCVGGWGSPESPGWIFLAGNFHVCPYSPR